ncbi:ABC-type dipeptide/oligopeptide/nickel transport systems, permease components [Microbacterium testaceum StLB037]|uniref:ABC-type dipeptide/oligopeptide/nickel transport systems, permease components n=1 Tax=Microbacterium testaceum (strain StLB037) TaxID=979556 RepID=E8NAZ2_MICTS|nr:hypothetical protein [Microbacterium testaceum]BAJ73414.1 ABC-type dipeptide/oligopeptide/nickel transport systems, permease components [Microbacterium testaceum StLB037]
MGTVTHRSSAESVMIADRPAPSVATPSARTMWAKVDTGFWVAHRAGEYFGCVDEVAGGYVSRDAHGIPIGRYDGLEEAKASLRSTTHPLNVARRRRAERVSLAAATAVGVTALGFALTAGALAPFL